MKPLFRATVALAALVAASLIGAVLVAAPAHAVVPTRVLVVGDSISQGSAGDYTWRYRLWKRLQVSAPGGVDFVGDRTYLFDNIAETQGSQAYADGNFDKQHHALWGRPLAFEKDTIRAAVDNSAAQVVLVLLGINDLTWLGATPTQVAGYMDEFIANARAANPSVRIVIGHVLTRYDIWNATVLNAAAVADLNNRYNQLASQRSTATSRVVTASTDVGWDPKAHTWDGTHPNATGEVRIAAKFADALAGLAIGAPYGTIPTSVPWGVAAGATTLTSLDRAVRLSWPATAGANAYFIEQKLVSLGETGFTRLPYPVPGNSWTAQLLLAGWIVEYRVVPVKGLMSGLAGAAGRTTVGGVRPTDRPLLYGAPSSDEHSAQLLWTAVDNATGYYIEQMDLGSHSPSWTRLPYAVPGTSFNPGLLQVGHWYRFRVVPTNGLLTGPASASVDIRTTGVPLYEAFYALGDSYSSGLGTLGTVGSYTGGDCKRSSVAWPYLAKAGWDPTPVHLACAGAKTPDLRGGQLSSVPLYPGAALITLTIGGNDVDFGPEATKCWKEDCTGDESTLNARIDAMDSTLRANYRDIRNRAPGADIVVAGYPKLIMPPETANCSIAFRSGVPGFGDGFQDNEKRMIRRLSARLNGVIQRAGDAEGVVIAVREVEGWFDGHEACAGSNGEYINQLAECSAYPVGCAGTLHPNYGGQLAYAFAVNQRRSALADHGYVRY